MKKNFQLTLVTLMIFTFVSCGGYDDDDSDDSTSVPQEEQSQEGTYRTVANAVNPDVTSSAGATQVRVEGDQFEVELFGSGPSTTHGQYIHAGTRCPTDEDDTNGDGVIDSVEGLAVYGERVISLDSDLASNGGVFPFAPTYRYAEDASVSEMLSNLNIPTLDLEEKVITIQGVPEATTLPATAQGPKSDFPIACGVLQRVE